MHQPTLKMFEERRIYSVSQIVDNIRFELETRFNDIWVKGEISNFRRPPSGHCYFTLKDRNAQIRAVCFRLQAQTLRFAPEDGMDVICRGSVSVYPPRGDFQLIVEIMDPVGRGALQIAFEQLKAKLAAEGLFDEKHKKPLPRLPSKVGVVTSPSGAAIQDILRVLKRRNDRLDVLIFPVKVQGTGAAVEIARGVRYMSKRKDVDVIIVGRGGGSLEDLWAFNEEPVARAIHHCPKPIISAVGHEIDFTIADFAADIRAATPSAAAEMVSAAREELTVRLDHLTRRSGQAMHLLTHRKRHQLQRLAASRAFTDAEAKLKFFHQRLDELRSRLMRTLPQRAEPARRQLAGGREKLDRAILLWLEGRNRRLRSLSDQLKAFSPLAVLDRGYAIVTTESDEIVRRPEQISPRQRLSVRVSGGSFRVRKEE